MHVLVMFFVPLFHGVCNMLEGHLSKYSIKSLYSMVFFSMVTHIVGAAFLAILLGIPPLPGTSTLMIIFAAAVICIFLHFPFFIAYRYIDTSTVGAFLSLGKISTPILAFLILGEQVSALQYIGFGVIILASVALGWDGKSKLKINAGLLFMLATSALASMESIALRSASGTDWFTVAFWFIIFQATLPFFLLFIKQARTDILATLPQYKSLLPYFLIITFFGLLGTFARVYALSELPVVVASAINSIRPILVLGMGMLAVRIFPISQINEKTSSKQITKKLLCFTFIIIGTWITIGLF